MKRILIGLFACVIGLVSVGESQAQYFRPQPRGHYDYHPGQFEQHRNHFHYVPGHYDYHRGSHYNPTPNYQGYGSQPSPGGYNSPSFPGYGQPGQLQQPFAPATNPGSYWNQGSWQR